MVYLFNGIVEVDLVYVNYGDDLDFEMFVVMNVMVKGNIVIIWLRSVSMNEF